MRLSLTLTAAVSGLAAAAIVIAGPLNPPAGPVAPTMKTLAEVEPRIPINAQTCPGVFNSSYGVIAPGSYYLTGDLVGEPGKHVIRVGHNVTIDLNGFSVVGGPGSLSGIDGEITEAANVTIRNGTIRSCGGKGIDMDGSSYGWIVEGVHVVWCGGDGIQLARHCIARNSRASSNGGTGFMAQWGSLFENCTAEGNAKGFDAGNASTVTACAAISNVSDGFHAHTGSTVTACSARFNQDGFALDSGATISGCSASQNNRDGIRLGVGCSALDNTCADNNRDPQALGAGIRAVGERNRIEGNNVTGNNYGIRTEAPGSFIARNTARGHALFQDFSLDFGCTFGPIISATGPITSDNPWANFAY